MVLAGIAVGTPGAQAECVDPDELAVNGRDCIEDPPVAGHLADLVRCFVIEQLGGTC